MAFKILLLLILQFLAGFTLLSKSGLAGGNKVQLFSLSWLAGFVLSTVVVYLVGLLFLPLNYWSFMGLMAVATVGMAYPFKPSMVIYRKFFTFSRPSFYLHDVVYAGIIIYILSASAWKTYYHPVTSFDSIVGIDLYAKFAVKEQTLIPSIFDVNIIPVLSTQAFYAPFTSFMQMIWRMCGTDFGQYWLILFTAAWVVFLYSRFAQICGSLLGGIVVIMILFTPELYAYTFILQTDFSNAAFLSVSILFLYSYVMQKEKSALLPAVLFMFATLWSRSESVLFLPLFVLSVLFADGFKAWKKNLKPALWACTPVLAYVLWNVVFYKFYFPHSPGINTQIVAGNYSGENLGMIRGRMMDEVMSVDGYWGYVHYVFFAVLGLNLILVREWKSLFLVLWIVFIIGCFYFMLIHFPLVNVEATFRRGYFKIVILMYVFVVLTGLATRLKMLLEKIS